MPKSFNSNPFAYRLGYRQGVCGQPEYNPYPYPSKYYYRWKAGYMAGQLQMQKDAVDVKA